MSRALRGKNTIPLAAWILIAMALAAPNQTYACTPPPETPWFVTSLHFLSANSPSDILVHDTSWGDVNIENRSKEDMEITLEKEFKQMPFHLAPGDTATLTTNGGEIIWVGEYSFVTSVQPHNVIADNRPANPPIPAPQAAHVEISAGGRSYSLELQVQYQLNIGYINNSVYVYEHSCTGYNWPIDAGLSLVPYACLLMICVVALVIGIRAYRRAPR